MTIAQESLKFRLGSVFMRPYMYKLEGAPEPSQLEVAGGVDYPTRRRVFFAAQAALRISPPFFLRRDL